MITRLTVAAEPLAVAAVLALAAIAAAQLFGLTSILVSGGSHTDPRRNEDEQ